MTVDAKNMLAEVPVPSAARPATVEEVQQLKTWWMGSGAQPSAAAARSMISTPEMAEVARITIERLRRPASASWIAARVSTMLAQYFKDDMPPGFYEAIAGDWRNELDGLPSWSIALAVRWWIGAENPKRRQRPLPGDISSRAAAEMGLLHFLEYGLAEWRRPTALVLTDETRRQREAGPTEAQKKAAQEMVEKLFRAPKPADGVDD